MESSINKLRKNFLSNVKESNRLLVYTVLFQKILTLDCNSNKTKKHCIKNKTKINF